MGHLATLWCLICHPVIMDCMLTMSRIIANGKLLLCIKKIKYRNVTTEFERILTNPLHFWNMDMRTRGLVFSGMWIFSNFFERNWYSLWFFGHKYLHCFLAVQIASMWDYWSKRCRKYKFPSNVPGWTFYCWIFSAELYLVMILW